MKDESAVMVLNQKPYSEVTAETKFDKNYGGGTTCFIGVEIEKPRLGNCRLKVQSRDALQAVDARNL